jgi:hypothetical protein
LRFSRFILIQVLSLSFPSFFPMQVAMDHVRTNTSVRPLSTEPKIGAHDTPVFFVHPKDMHGVLTEFEQVKK